MSTTPDPWDPNLTIDTDDPAWEGDPPGQGTQPCPKHLVDGKITVTILYADDHEPFDKVAKVYLENPPGQPNPGMKRSDKTGKVVFTGLGHGNYRCTAIHAGFDFIPEGGRHWGSDELTLLAKEKKDVHWGMDTNLGDAHDWKKVNLANIKKRPWKMDWIGRYVTWDRDHHPPLARDEAKHFCDHGFQIVALWEKAKYRAIANGVDHKARGHGDANRAFNHLADVVKAPDNAVCYFTADFDPKGGQIESDLNRVEEYFHGINDHFKGDNSRIGVYGTYKCIERLYSKNLIKYAWQMTFDGKGKTIDKRVNIYQYDIWQHNTGPTFGVSGAGAIDLDCAVTGSDYGAFKV
ncbi:MAG: DUF1906 domain-containing protein [Kofleriaceae bacterium]